MFQTFCCNAAAASAAAVSAAAAASAAAATGAATSAAASFRLSTFSASFLLHHTHCVLIFRTPLLCEKPPHAPPSLVRLRYFKKELKQIYISC